MWGWLSRSDDLVTVVKSINNFKELHSLKEFLLDETKTVLLRDSQIQMALREIPIQMIKVIKEMLL